MVTHDPLPLRIEDRRLYVDLGAERSGGPGQASEQVAVEVKSFLNDSAVYELEAMVGQYVIYRELLAIEQPGRECLSR